MPKNSMQDIIFAESYVDFLSRRGQDIELRSRAQLVQATIRLLDANRPSWRQALLTRLQKDDEPRRLEDIFPIPDNLGDTLLNQYLKILQKEQK